MTHWKGDGPESGLEFAEVRWGDKDGWRWSTQAWWHDWVEDPDEYYAREVERMKERAPA